MSEEKFVPPKLNALLTRLLQSIAVAIAYLVYKLKIEVSDREIEQLKAISHHRVIYLPNHSNLDDGLVVFLFSTHLGQLFNYVVAREAFRGWIGKLMQLVGAYSIRRGVGDRASIIQTLKIMQQPRCKLVIFPEGGCSYQNDTVIPFRTGGIELSFKAMDKLSKQGTEAADLYLVPVSLKYTYPNATEAQIAEALQGLEIALAIEPDESDFYLRLRAVAAQILTNLETEYGITVDPAADWNQRIKKLKQHLLDYCEDSLKLATGLQLPNRERVYQIQSTLRSIAQNELPQQPDIDYTHLHLTTVRLLNFDAIYDGYVAAKPTPERFFATLDRLEREVYQIDQPKLKGLRQVIITTGTPINLQDYYCQGKEARQQAIAELTKTIQQTVQTNLQ